MLSFIYDKNVDSFKPSVSNVPKLKIQNSLRKLSQPIKIVQLFPDEILRHVQHALLLIQSSIQQTVVQDLDTCLVSAHGTEPMASSEKIIFIKNIIETRLNTI